MKTNHYGLAAAFALCALAELALLATHPNDGARTFADFIRYEAAHQLIDGLVHGGFIVTLSALMVCFMFLSRLLGSARVPVVIGLAAFGIGSAALMSSMVLDGLATPAVAIRFVATGAADDLVLTKTLMVLFGTLIRILMPMGLAFQAAAILAWSVIIVSAAGLRRFVGALGLFTATFLIVAPLSVTGQMATHVLLGGILLQAIWYFALAALLFRGFSPNASGLAL